MHLDWPGARNTRYLSGLPAGQFVVKDLIRSDSPDQVEAEHLRRQGVTTIIDLRNPDERAGLRHFSLHLPLDGVEDREFWSEWGQKVEFGTPLYYAPHLSRMPERSARVLSAMAAAPPGTLLFHCVIGRDRTGMIAMLLLSHLGVEPEHVRQILGQNYERNNGDDVQGQAPFVAYFIERIGEFPFRHDRPAGCCFPYIRLPALRGLPGQYSKIPTV